MFIDNNALGEEYMTDTLPKLLQQTVRDHPDTEVQLWKDDNGKYHPTTYKEFYQEVLALASGLKSLGVQREESVGLIADNRREWLIADFALLSLGAADVPRGRDATLWEIEYILSFTECRISFVENEEQLEKIKPLLKKLPKLKTIIIMDPQFKKSVQRSGKQVIPFSSVMDNGSSAADTSSGAVESMIEEGSPDDTATIIFTSGTTGTPKGVMLTHRNFLHQVEGIPEVVAISPGDRWLSVLPVWHSFERILQYVIVGSGSTIAYSKPIGKIMLQDFQKVRPMWMGSVPRIWESIKTGVFQNVAKKPPVSRALFKFFVWAGTAHAVCSNMVRGWMPRFRRRIRALDFAAGIIPWLLLWPLKLLGGVLVFNTIKKKIGGRFKAGVSGGGSLPSSVDAFFQAIGVILLDGYGLTETAPVIGIRPFFRRVPRTVSPFPGTEIKIVDEHAQPVKPGVKGVIKVRGPQVMKGYYKQEEMTKAVIDGDGWLNTGDLGVWTYDGEYAIRGREKDTIVLSGGENVEPVPIEAKLRESSYIEQAVILGQDQKYLAALIVIDTKEVEQYVYDSGLAYFSRDDFITMAEVHELINYEIESLINSKNGFKSFEHIYRFKLLDRSFQLGRELSAKQEVKRHQIAEMYEREIRDLFT